jgi:hypothetical protein
MHGFRHCEDGQVAMSPGHGFCLRGKQNLPISDEAIQLRAHEPLDCFATLAMTEGREGRP